MISPPSSLPPCLYNFIFMSLDGGQSLAGGEPGSSLVGATDL